MRLIIEARLEGNDIEPTVVPIPLGRVNSHGFARSRKLRNPVWPDEQGDQTEDEAIE